MKFELPAEPATHLLCDSLNSRLVELPAENGTIRLHGDAVLLAVGDDVLLLAERVQLDNDSEGRSASAYQQRVCCSIGKTYLDLVYRRLLVPCCGQFFQM